VIPAKARTDKPILDKDTASKVTRPRRPSKPSATTEAVLADGFVVGNKLHISSEQDKVKTATALPRTTKADDDDLPKIGPLGSSPWAWVNGDRRQQLAGVHMAAVGEEPPAMLPQITAADLRQRPTPPLIVLRTAVTDFPKTSTTTEGHYHDHDHHHEEEHHHGEHGQHDHHHHHSHHPHADHSDLSKDIPIGGDVRQEGPSPPTSLSASRASLDAPHRNFVAVFNRLGLQVYRDLLRRGGLGDDLAFSPLSLSAALAAMFMGARGLTSWQMNEVLHLDDINSFNPHLLYKNLTEELNAHDDYGGTRAACAKQLLVDEVYRPESI